MLFGWPCVLSGNTADWHGPGMATFSVSETGKIFTGVRSSH